MHEDIAQFLNEEGQVVSWPAKPKKQLCTCGASCYPTTGQSTKLYLYLVCMAGADHRKKEEQYRLRMRKLVDAIKEKLMKDFKPTKANYERYVAAMRRAIDVGINDVRKQRRALNARKEKAQKGLENLVVRNGFQECRGW